MASNIEFQTIDALFPVAGQDNNSQGFRDNFSIIKNSLQDASTEITDLQENVARKDKDNDFATNTLTRLNLDTFTATSRVAGTQTSSSEISILNGHYHKLTIGADVTLTLVDWPNSNLSRMTVELVANDQGPFTVSFVGEGTNQKIRRESGSVWDPSSTPIKLDVEISSDTIVRVFEFWTYDNGQTIYAKHIGDFE